MREAIELDVACECAERLGHACHREIEYDDSVPNIHRGQAVGRDRDEEERRKVGHGLGSMGVIDRFVSFSDARIVVCT